MLYARPIEGINQEQLIADGLANQVRESRYLQPVAEGITSVSVHPDLQSFQRSLPLINPRDGISEISILDFDGVVDQNGFGRFLKQIILGKGDFNQVQDGNIEAMKGLQERGGVIVTTNRAKWFDGLLEARNATPVGNSLDGLKNVPYVSGIDRQDPFRNNERGIIEKIKAGIQACGLDQKANTKILRLVFDIRTSTAAFNDMMITIGQPLELNSIIKITKAASELGISFDEIHLGLIDHYLSIQPEP